LSLRCGPTTARTDQRAADAALRISATPGFVEAIWTGVSAQVPIIISQSYPAKYRSGDNKLLANDHRAQVVSPLRFVPYYHRMISGYQSFVIPAGSIRSIQFQAVSRRDCRGG
jgi:hypothetical protein